MANSPKDASGSAETAAEPAGYLDMPAERRVLAKAHAAMLAQTAARIALELPFSAGVDDFRRVLSDEARQ
jgi:hypothetical protein